jgi:glycosyltransferase involved in cell wall biosynthesis
VKDDPRAFVLHITDLPENWLGKVHALHQGVQKASGKWLLFTDADVHLSEGVLEQGISYAENKGLAHLALLPNMVSEQFIVNCVISTLLRLLLMGLRPWRFQNSSKSEALGVGGFNLVKRDAFLDTPGFEWLRMEVADDIGVGYLIKENGGQTEALFAIDSVRVNWYPSLPALVKGVEKNAFAQLAQFTLWKGLLWSFSFLMILSSLVIVWWMPPYWSGLVWGAFLLSALICSGKFSQELKINFLVSFFSFFFGELIMSWVILRSTILGVRRGGLIWRGTVYNSQALKDGTKVKF